jgi:uncharacterized protein (TIGR02145 family)
VPSQKELETLHDFDVQDLKSTDYWIVPGGTNATGFNALPAGKYNGATNRFEDMYGVTGYWANNATPNQNPYYYSISYYCNMINKLQAFRTDGLSVRCVMDYE